MRASWGHKIIIGCGPRLVRLGVGAGLLSMGCSVDQRTLSSGAAASTGNGASSGAAGAATDAMRGTDEMDPPPELPVCDYGTDVEPGCESLVKNPGFESAITPWKAEDGMLSDWAKDDAAASDHSGSLRVINFLHGETDGVAPGAAVQCVVATAGHTYDVAGDVFIRDGQGDGLKAGEGHGLTAPPYQGNAGFSMFFFGREGCKEQSIGNADSPLTNKVGTWVHVTGSGTAPEQAKSLAIRLNTLMPFREFAFEALFDNVLVRER
jgi:hypothetical protein